MATRWDEASTSGDPRALPPVADVAAGIITLVGMFGDLSKSLGHNRERKSTVESLQKDAAQLRSECDAVTDPAERLAVNQRLDHMIQTSQRLKKDVSRGLVSRAAHQLICWTNFDRQISKLRNGLDDIARLVQSLPHIETQMSGLTGTSSNKDIGVAITVFATITTCMALFEECRKAGRNLGENEDRIATVELLVTCVERLARAFQRVLVIASAEYVEVANGIKELDKMAKELLQGVSSNVVNRARIQVVSWTSFDEQIQKLREGLDSLMKKMPALLQRAPSPPPQAPNYVNNVPLGYPPRVNPGIQQYPTPAQGHNYGPAPSFGHYQPDPWNHPHQNPGHYQPDPWNHPHQNPGHYQPDPWNHPHQNPGHYQPDPWNHPHQNPGRY